MRGEARPPVPKAPEIGGSVGASGRSIRVVSSDAIESFWREFAAASRVTAEYEAWAFGGDEPTGLADELAGLVLHGPKRATTSVYEEILAEGSVPQAGDYSVILDSSGAPVCIILTTQVDVVPFGEVDEEFAWTEGEGDRSLAYWRRAHIDFFAGEGVTLDESTPLVLERFDLVWPEVSP